MLAQRSPTAATTFTPRDLRRLATAAVILTAALSAIFALDLLPQRLVIEVNDVASADIVAPRTGSYVSQIQTQAARDEARKAVQPVYDFSDEKADRIATAQVAAFERLVRPIDAAFEPDIKPENRQALLDSVDGLSEDARVTLDKLDADAWHAVRDEAERVLDLTERQQIRDTDDLTPIRAGLSGQMVGLEKPERSLAAELIAPLVVPNSSFSQSLTAAATARAIDAVPDVVVDYRQNETIVRKGEKITPVILEAINEFGLTESKPDIARLGGWVVLSGLIVGLVLAWVWRFRPQLWHRTNALVLIGLVVVGMTLLLKVTAFRAGLPFVLPSAAAGMLLAILLDSGVATVVLAVLAIVAGAVNGNEVEMAAYLFFGGLAGIITIRRGDRFQVFLQAGLVVAIVNVLVVAMFGFLGSHDARGVIELMGASVLSAAGSAIAAVGSFAVLGSVFGILTVFQLLELANPSQPLLRRLLIETPGTYHHSLMVGNLAERAAEAIGADPLLTRVAAYYHDVGKLANPLAFIENQAGGENIHDELDPETSAQILKQHTADGIDIAYKAKLPKTLIAFIPQHHGTAIMSYFYARAKGAAAEPYGGPQTADGARAAAAVDERKFRHSGPKPQTREAALIMLADGVEASVRSLSSRDEPAIRAMVARIIDERLSDGQFDECDLTLRDVEKIKEAFVQQLLGMYHQRIAYPQNKVVELESRRNAGSGSGA
ncbi:MAG TPA: HDIG domain-containing protein [Candidatus Limnocylindrales bacterium]|nr:HDIG domain-containing protein [Candidatus Limnocylindrales bacterium]